MPEAAEGLLHEPLAIFLAILAIILVAPILSERLRLPGIVGLVVGGMLVGPFGFNILANGRIIELFSTIGLIYLMFNAGLEIDLGQFNKVRNRAITFGIFTFLIPLIGGTILGRFLGYSWAGAILLGSALSSHTLIAFPILGRLGVVSNETVSVTVGATVFTDISAFLVLAVITGMSGGDIEIGQFTQLLLLMVGFAALLVWGVPRLGKFLLRYLHGRDVEFQFVLVTLFLAALLAEWIGVHAVVGAFLTGLAINSMLPHRSQVTGRLLFVGEALFIPSFLVYSGMITDPTAFIGGEALTIGIALTVIAYVAKWAAAWLTCRIFVYSSDEMWTMWGLSQCQAAVTLPTVLVGVEAGLFPVTVFNGTMLMILATCITSPLLTQRFGAKLRLPLPQFKSQGLFDQVLLGLSNPQTLENMITLMDVLVYSKRGTLMPLNVAIESPGGQIRGLDTQQLALNTEILRGSESNIQLIERIDDSLAKGILHAAVEKKATLITLGWRGQPTFSQNVFGSVLDEVLWGAQIPVMVTRLTQPINSLQQVVMVLAPRSTALDYIDEMADAAMAIADAVNVPLLVLTAQNYYSLVCDCLKNLNMEHPYEVEILGPDVVGHIQKHVDPNDLLLLSITGNKRRFQSSLGRISEALVANTQNSIVVIHYPH